MPPVSNGRPLFVFSARANAYPVSIFSTTAGAATLAVAIALAKPLVPRNASGKIGIRFLGKVHNPNLGVHVFAIVGGGTANHTGVASPEAVMTLEGLNTSPRLEVDISGLYAAGRTVEYVKLFTYATTGGGGGLPSLDIQTMMFSGDPGPPVGPDTTPDPTVRERGDDLDVRTDVSRTSFSLAAGVRNIGNALARRLITPRGGLLYDPSYGTDIRAYMNAGFTPSKLAQLASEIEAEVLKDSRVATAVVAVQTTGSSMTISVRVDLSQGPFELIFRSDGLTLDLLTVNSVGGGA
jgi:phage baseplate assembly protein W